MFKDAEVASEARNCLIYRFLHFMNPEMMKFLSMDCTILVKTLTENVSIILYYKPSALFYSGWGLPPDSFPWLTFGYHNY